MAGEAPQPGRTEEWREPEPVDDPRELFDAGTAASSEQAEIDLRSELARLLTRDEFPAGRAALLGVLDAKGASQALVARVGELPAGDQYRSTHELLVALGISHPEEQPRG